VDNLGCRQFARSVAYTDPVFFDEEYAKSQGHRGIVAPAGFLGHPIYNPARPARGPEITGLDIPLKRVLNGGTDFEYFDEVCAGDVLTSTMKIADITEREGKMGPMIIVNTESTFMNQAGKIVAVMRGTMIRY
jgi:hydroxyacyl-ACP dehydratase HTD2-like protein with hotdog domain